MVAAIKTVETAARRAEVESRPARKSAQPISRRRRKMRSATVSRTVIFSMLGVLSLGYIGLHAQVATYGYKRDKLFKANRQMKMENQALEAEILTLSSPDRLAAAAASAGMEPGVQVDYISQPTGVKVAKAE